MTMTHAWYVVHTRPNAEAVAAHHLIRQGFPVFLPRYPKRRRHARMIEIVPRPLFPRYLFVAVNLAKDRWRAIRSTIGVAALVCHGDRPAPVPEGVVEALLERCDDNHLIDIGNQPNYFSGDPVRILDGAFANLIGIIDRMTDGDRVAVLLNLMGRSVRVMLQMDVLEPAR
jgi:transcriptional antiterminator RfaH